MGGARVSSQIGDQLEHLGGRQAVGRAETGETGADPLAERIEQLTLGLGGVDHLGVHTLHVGLLLGLAGHEPDTVDVDAVPGLLATMRKTATLPLLGEHAVARMGFYSPALGLFGDKLDHIRSMAIVRLALWEPSRQGILAFGSSDPEAFTPDMGSDLVAFLARVVERTAERWPVL